MYKRIIMDNIEYELIPVQEDKYENNDWEILTFTRYGNNGSPVIMKQEGKGWNGVFYGAGLTAKDMLDGTLPGSYYIREVLRKRDMKIFKVEDKVDEIIIYGFKIRGTEMQAVILDYDRKGQRNVSILELP